MKITEEQYLEAKKVVKIYESILSITPKVSFDMDLQLMPSRIFVLSVRLSHTLRAAEIDKVRDLVGMSVEEYQAYRNTGRKTIYEIRELYKVLGLELLENRLNVK